MNRARPIDIRADSARPGESGQSIARLLDAVVAAAPEANAVIAPGRVPLTYRGLRSHVRQTREALRTLGVGRHDRVAVVVPDGPEMAVVFLAVAASAACAPLNPGFRANEFDASLSDLSPRVLIVQGDLGSPAAAVARRQRIRVIELVPELQAEAGVFALRGVPRGQASDPAVSQPGDTALLLSTSGTTARPRLVPLTNASLCAAARTVATTLALRPDDRCLNVMPLFHVHGLVAAVLSTFVSGGSIVCPAGFDPAGFFRWLEEFRPTWYTAVPTIHQAILLQASHYRAIIERSPLRLIRSCSAPLPERVSIHLERTFGTAVIEAYGMTECSHQVCSNPVAGGRRKRGSVGPATGCELAILDAAGQPAPPGATGEVVVRGPGVTAGYEGDAAANAEVFRDGWLRTGDLGRLDDDGYLYLQGRIKEIINRGGEKIAPREIEEVLMGHPAVAQAVVFPLPHPVLGEEVGAAVVTRIHASEGDLRLFAAERLADFKVPARVLIVDRIPQGATGKLQRTALAERFAEQLRSTFTAPTDALERALAETWTRVLEAGGVGIHDNFFELGGYSLAAVRMLADIEALTGRRLPMATLFQAPTVAQLAAVLREPAMSAPWPSLVAIHPTGSRPPFFCVHGETGNVLEYHRLAAQLGPDQPFYGLQARGLDDLTCPHCSVETMAADYIAEVQTVQPRGPYFIGGRGIGGLAAFEMARQLDAAGHHVAMLSLLDTSFKNLRRDALMPDRGLLPAIAQRMEFHWHNLTQLGPCDMRRPVYIRKVVRAAITRRLPGLACRISDTTKVEEVPPPAVTARIRTCHRDAEAAYVPDLYRGRITLFLARQQEEFSRIDPRVPWGLAGGGIEIHKVPGNHWTMVHSWPHVRVLGRRLRACLDRAFKAIRAGDPGAVFVNHSGAAPTRG